MDEQQSDEVDFDGESGKPAMTEVRAGLQRVYLEGLEYLGGKITEVENEVEKVKLSYYQCDEVDEDNFKDFLKQCDDHFLQANNELRRNDMTLVVIDAETRIIALLNNLRDLEFDQDCVSFLTEYWENIKDTTDRLRTIVSKFQTNVLNRLKMNCTSYNDTGVQLDVSYRYTEEISGNLTNLENILANTQELIKSYNGGLHQELFENTPFSERILVSCDLKAFPVLRFVADITAKIEAMCGIARRWLERDERYMYEIHHYIRQTRSITRKREEDLRNEKEKHKKFGKSVRAANILLQNNKQKLQKMEEELNSLEGRFNGTINEKKCKFEEKQQKESMVDFLKLTLSQTKRNYSLQMKRSKLLKQVKELEHLLMGFEKDLTYIQDEISAKAQEKVLLAEKVEASQRSYVVLKSDLNKFSNNLEKLEFEVNGLSSQLLQLEIIQTFKTSPEKIEEIYDRPSSVKLAPSLQEKIKKRRLKTQTRTS